ncbi:unnamed protein product [Paramecium octaurelia]|uniref:Uncharacterized protein n=1 Tax=Paramecium octaurelia TaxID=43137 RepID=A0A8S1X5I8_PAROT|nr:unnamed protein product [Paramecium octaurelia]
MSIIKDLLGQYQLEGNSTEHRFRNYQKFEKENEEYYPKVRSKTTLQNLNEKVDDIGDKSQRDETFGLSINYLPRYMRQYRCCNYLNKISNLNGDIISSRVTKISTFKILTINQLTRKSYIWQMGGKTQIRRQILLQK